MLEVDHVDLRRWRVDFAMLSRDAYGHAYTLATTPARLQKMETDFAGIDFKRESADANAAELQKRATRKAAWLQTQNRSANG